MLSLVILGRIARGSAYYHIKQLFSMSSVNLGHLIFIGIHTAFADYVNIQKRYTFQASFHPYHCSIIFGAAIFFQSMTVLLSAIICWERFYAIWKPFDALNINKVRENLVCIYHEIYHTLNYIILFCQ